jgi:PAS domain S-box-containing protein
MSGKQNQMAGELPSSLVRETEAGAFAGIPAGPGDHPTTREAEDAPGMSLRQPLASWLEGGLAILDADGRVVEINETLSHWLGRPIDLILGHRFRALLEERCNDWARDIERLLDSSEPFASLRLALPSDDLKASESFCLELARHGKVTFVRFNSVLPPLAELEEAAWNEHLDPDSARREMFVRLVRAESQLKALTDRWPGVIFSQRADFTFRFASPRIVELTGIAIEDWKRKPHLFWQLVHEGDAEDLRQQIKHARQSDESVTSTFRVRHTQTGRISYVMEHRQAILSRSGLILGYEGVWLDVTRQTIAEKRLSSAAWKEALSVLTMGLAHDFSNVMAGIHALSETFLDQVGPQHGFSEGLSLIKSNSQQASQLVHRIINLHQGKTGESYYHNLNELANDAADLVRKILPRRMQFAVELAPDALPVHLDAIELRQVIINLVLNAVEAMPQTGRLVLRTSVHEKLPSLPQWQGVPPRTPAACLSIQDSGCGIKARHLASVFDPFFTTKPMNKGSGLGLYNAKLFAEKHRGAITVDSQEDVGTTFHLWLPQADFTETEPADLRSVSAGSRRQLLLAGRSGKTLDGTAEFLRTNGYHVATTASGEIHDALRSRDGALNGLVLLAEPGDKDLIRIVPEVRREHPQLRLILKVVGVDHEELPSELLRQADLIISPDLSPARILEKLAKQF